MLVDERDTRRGAVGGADICRVLNPADGEVLGEGIDADRFLGL